MNYSFQIILVFNLLLLTAISAQKFVNVNKLSTDYVIKSNVENRKAELELKINSIFRDSLKNGNEESWKKLLSELTISNYQSEFVDDKIIEILKNWGSINPKLMHAAMEYAAAKYSQKFSSIIKTIFMKSIDPKNFAQAGLILMKNDSAGFYKEEILKQIDSRFANPNLDLTLFMLKHSLIDTGNSPPLIDLLQHKFQNDKTIIYSIHRKNRIYPGITVIKDPSGKFVRNDDSTIFYIPQLACSISEMPGYIIDGNTPQGIFSVVGSYISPTESIGPTPIVLTRIPFGKPPEVFYHGFNKTNKWNLEEYLELYPKSWQNYFPITEAFYSGEIGRRLIVMHGSADDLNDYRDKVYFPLTPTRGCISAKEIWSDETGECLESDQVKLMNAFYSTGNIKGFLVVVEIDDKEQQVDIDEISDLLFEAEQLIYN